MQHREPLTQPDDITRIGGVLFTGFQNGVGPQGQASTDGNRDSTIVEFTRFGSVLHQWDIRGKCDGLTANPANGLVVATVNEDAHSSLYTINPFTGQAGHPVKLGLTDPDSNEVVPAIAPRFPGDFMLTSQGDKEQIYVHGVGIRHHHLWVLDLSQPVDDTAWATTFSGQLFATDHDADTVSVVSGLFIPGTAFVAVTPCDANTAPATCPAPGFPANYLGTLNMFTGHIGRVSLRGASLEPQGMIFVPF